MTRPKGRALAEGTRSGLQTGFAQRASRTTVPYCTDPSWLVLITRDAFPWA